MDYFGYFSSACIFFGLVQLLAGASLEDKFEPMVAFICDRPAMYRGISGWIPDKKQDCPDTLEDVLAYCKKVYPNHNITNVVESSSFYDIDNWPMDNAGRKHTHHVRPFRCLVDGFQSDALLVPQHCEFDHTANINQCKEFSHWNTVAEEKCLKKGMHLESFGMLLYCKPLGHFNGVEYVCCPNPSDTRVHPEPKEDDKPDSWEEDEDEDSSESEEDDDDESASVELGDEDSPDVYEAYLRGLSLPDIYINEHQQYLAAKAQMLAVQKKKESKLLDQFEESQKEVDRARKTDPKAANKMNDEIATRFKHLYESFKQEDAAERLQLAALHQRRVLANLNERKREAMDKYLQALEDENIAHVTKYLHNYIKAVEKDRLHNVNHFEHLKISDPKEALRVHPHLIRHLKLTEMRIDQAMEMLTHYPQVESAVRPEVEEFMKSFNEIANRIKKVVIPVPEVPESSSYEDSDESTSDSSEDSDSQYELTSDIDEQSQEKEAVPNAVSESSSDDNSSSFNSGIIDDEVQEDEHSYERHPFAANAMSDTHSVQHNSIGSSGSSASSSGMGSTIGIVLGAISVMVIVVVAVVMVRHNKHRQPVSHGYVEVDPSASPEDRYLANMQMNGYENPTYKYFEVQTPKA